MFDTAGAKLVRTVADDRLQSEGRVCLGSRTGTLGTGWPTSSPILEGEFDVAMQPGLRVGGDALSSLGVTAILLVVGAAIAPTLDASTVGEDWVPIFGG